MKKTVKSLFNILWNGQQVSEPLLLVNEEMQSIK
jgi:hypothetical protein